MQYESGVVPIRNIQQASHSNIPCSVKSVGLIAVQVHQAAAIHTKSINITHFDFGLRVRKGKVVEGVAYACSEINSASNISILVSTTVKGMPEVLQPIYPVYFCTHEHTILSQHRVFCRIMEFHTCSFLGSETKTISKTKLFTSIKHALKARKAGWKQKHIIYIDHDAMKLIINPTTSSILLQYGNQVLDIHAE